MNENYDVIILGTGLKECLLGGLLSKLGKLPNCENEHIKILQIDRNNYYGSDSASLNLTNLWKRFRGDQTPPEEFGENRDWNVDLIPKFVMANGNLVKLLLKTNVSQYLEWKCVDGTFVYQWEKPFFGKPHGVIHKVPSTPSEAFSSSLMGLLEKNRCRKFFSYINDFELKDTKTYQGQDPKAPFSKLVKSFGLEVNTIDFIGHAIALYTDDSFMDLPAINTIDKMQLYSRSISAGYGNSPFIYPVWGLSGLAEGFSRLTALYGEILYDENGKFKGIKCEDGCAYAKYCIAEPSYVPKEKLKSLGKIIRAICILDHPLPGKAEKFDSCQIIIPQRQTGRKNDIFIAALNHTHCVCKKGFYLAIISTNVETDNPEAELEKAYELIGSIKEKFVTISDQYEPIDKTYQDNVFVTTTFDPLSHFEEDIETVISLYEKMSGSKLDLEITENEEHA